MVSTNWFKLWKAYTGTEVEKINVATSPIKVEIVNATRREAEYPGPIFNDELVNFKATFFDPEDDIGITRYALKPNLIEEEDYILVPNELWKLWYTTYGGLDLPRKGRMGEDRKYKLELYLKEIALLFRPPVENIPKELRVIYVSAKDTGGELKKKAERICERFTSKTLILRLWKICRDDVSQLERVDWRTYRTPKMHFGIEGELIDEKAKIEDLNLEEANVILVEIEINGKDFTFKEQRTAAPRISTNRQLNNWGDYVTLEDNKFTQIPLKLLANPVTAKCGRTGLYNLRNTCYINSAIQCLSHCEELTKYFLTKLYEADINKTNPLGHQGKLAIAYGNLLSELWLGHCNAISPGSLKDLITAKAGQFEGYSQQDSQEFVHYMLDILSEDLNRVKDKPYVEFKDIDNMPEAELSKKLWDYYLSRNNSIITDFFCGQLRSSLACPECNHKSVAFDPFTVLSLSVPRFIEIKVLFFPLYMCKNIISITMTVPHCIRMSDLSTKLTNHLSLPTTSNIAFALIDNKRSLKKLNLRSSYAEFPKNDTLCAYEYEVVKEKEDYLWEVKCKVSGKKELKYPLLCNIPLDCTIVELKKRIIRKFKDFSTNSENPFDEAEVEANPFADSPLAFELVNDIQRNDNNEPCSICKIVHINNCKLNSKEIQLKDIASKIDKPIIELILNKEPKNCFYRYRQMIIPKDKEITLYDCLGNFSVEEELDERNKWDCPKCKKLVKAIKRIAIYRLPKILTIHIKRFKEKHSCCWCCSNRKLEEPINYPIIGLDLKDYVLSSDNGSREQLYDLFAVSNHRGRSFSGHYTAVCYNAAVGRWFWFNDESVSRANEEDVISKAAYVLFYRRIL